jgi:hypothetical protein
VVYVVVELVVVSMGITIAATTTTTTPSTTHQIHLRRFFGTPLALTGPSPSRPS